MGSLRKFLRAPVTDVAPAVNSDLQSLQRELTDVDQRLTALASSPQKLPAPDATALQLTTVQSTLESTSKRLEKIEQIILADPAKALEITLLKRDIQSLQVVQQATMEAVKKDVDRLDLWAKAIVGLIFLYSIAPTLERIFRSRAAKQTTVSASD